jgi:hypothetical protein
MFLYLLEHQRVLKEGFANTSSDHTHEGREGNEDYGY